MSLRSAVKALIPTRLFRRVVLTGAVVLALLVWAVV